MFCLNTILYYVCYGLTCHVVAFFMFLVYTLNNLLCAKRYFGVFIVNSQKHLQKNPTC